MTTRKILVTGATGYIGLNLIKRLVISGYEVNILCRKSSNLDQVKLIIDPGNIFIHDDDSNLLSNIVSKVMPHYVFHLAAEINSNNDWAHTEKLVETNIVFGLKLIDAMLNNNCLNLINVGTYWQQYNNEDYNPCNLYAATKQAFADLLRHYTENSPMKAVTLLLSDVYGPEDQRLKVLNLIHKAALFGGTLEMSKGEQWIDLIHINDVVDALIIAAKSLDGGIAKNSQFSITSGSPIKLTALVHLYEQATKRKVKVIWGAKEYRGREFFVPWSKGARLPGWECGMDLNEGLKNL